MKHKIYVDGIDYQYHIPDDFGGIQVFFSKESAKANLECWKECGIMELTLDCNNPKIIVREDKELALENAQTVEQISLDYIKKGPKKIWKEFQHLFWGIKNYIRCQYLKIKRKVYEKRIRT